MNLRVGMMVRYVGTYRFNDGVRTISPIAGRTGVITDDLGRRKGGSGKMGHYWVTDISPVMINDNVLIPINPDNEPACSFEDLMKDLNSSYPRDSEFAKDLNRKAVK
jgi:hypothetical protein